MKIRWSNPPSENATGDTVGYNNAGRALLAQIEKRRGVSTTFDPDEDADVEVFFGFAGHEDFSPKGDIPTVAFAMCETETISETFANGINKADSLVVPSAWCKQVFSRYTDNPIEVVPLGVDGSVFKFRKKKWRMGREPFRILFIGAPNLRKYGCLEDVAPDIASLASRIPLEVYIKTTGASTKGFESRLQSGAGELVGGVLYCGWYLFDNRKIPLDDVAKLYHSSHAVILPSIGEGFGLTGLEAMSCGVPLITTAATGQSEYANEDVASIIETEYRDVSHRVKENKSSPYWHDTHSVVHWPSARSLLHNIIDVMSDYPTAVRRANNARRVAREMSWSASASKLIDALSDAL